jgi:hypothetical protein
MVTPRNTISSDHASSLLQVAPYVPALDVPRLYAVAPDGSIGERRRAETAAAAAADASRAPWRAASIY